MSKKSGFTLPSDTKKWVAFVMFLVILGLAYLLFLNPAGEEEARLAQTQAEDLYAQAETIAQKTDTPQDKANVDLARSAIQRAQTMLIEGDFSEAMVEAERAKVHANKVIERQGTVRDNVSLVRVLELAGQVSVRRQFKPQFEEAKKDMAVEIGDLVRTGKSGAALISLTGGNEVLVEGNSSFSLPDLNNRVTGAEAVSDLFLGEGSIWIKSGQLSKDGRINLITDNGKVELYSNTNAHITYRNGGMSVRVRYGRAEIRGDKGSANVIKDQFIELEPGAAMGSPMSLPSPPVLSSPANFEEIQPTGVTTSIPLTWQGTRAPGGYQIDVSRDSLFNQMFYQRNNFDGTRIMLSDLRPGEYFWRVSAQDDNRRAGVPSEVRRFSVTGAGGGSKGSSEPPMLKITKVQVQGYIVIIEGLTEPDAKVKVKGELAVLDESTGIFSCAIHLPGRGVYDVDVIATDLAGNRTTKQQTIEIRD